AYWQPFSELAPRLIDAATPVLLGVMDPLLAVTALAATLTNDIAMGGPVLAFEPIKPNFDNVNPASGLKRIFSMKSVVEFLK
ncbi:EscU/YscU/HrcU family type III secretion system export apparatus switch protein, partial [Bacillus cereus]|uniref:EscU/YscU/HrcU family type III secretion system export apparatus switch protein n=1 Tax=Bacillus cereus TaxID=1396 RepID=UPI0021125AC8